MRAFVGHEREQSTDALSTEDAIAMQKLRLNEAQWARVIAENDLRPTAQFTPRSDATPSSSSLQVAYVLSLEGDEPNTKWSWYETMLDAVVQSAQPAPAMTHTEILLPPESGDDHEMHFALYLGKQAHWGSTFGGGTKFYLDPQGNGKSWRAVPIVGQDAVRRLRAECSKHSGTPYGPMHRLFNYPFSVPPGRSMAWMLDDSVGSPAHCASLTARCLRRALPEMGLSHPSAWYGPSTLYLELARESRMTSYKQYMTEDATVKATVELETAAKSADTLLRGSDDAVVALGHEECQCGIDLLTSKTIDAIVDGDVTAERLTQKNLARALLRWSQINRGGAAGVHAAGATTAGNAPVENEGSGGMFR